MKIAMVGAGHIGGNLTQLFTKAGHEVRVANSRGPETLTDLAQETGAIPSTVQDVARDANLVVVTIPMKNVPSLPDHLLDKAARDVVVIDTNNYYPKNRDGRIAEIEDGKTESRWVSDQLHHDVVKVFNGIYSKHLLTKSRRHGDPERIALPVAGDNSVATATVIGLLDQIGFDGVDAGSIDESWRQQPGKPVYGAEADADGIKKLLAEATPERPDEWRA